MPSILLVDDEPNLRRMVGALLDAESYEVHEARDVTSGLALALEVEPDLALLDLMMPGATDGLELLEKLRAHFPDLPVLMMSGRAGLADAVQAAKLGAVTFLEKPLSPEGLLLALTNALELRQARRERSALRLEAGLGGDLVGASSAMQRVRDEIARVAPTDARVLITGESGTGKELAAAAIHAQSGRRDKPFVRVNGAAIPRDLLESEMFGHERGAFTGAIDRRIGKFELAHSGTLLLDEVGELSLEAQAKLLRAIEAREIERVGGRRTIRVDVRVIAATNRDLVREVREGRFREDLYFRLNVIPIHLPPLREHPGDIPLLVAHFATQLRRRSGQPAPDWQPEAIDALTRHGWPGNVRELANIIERLSILHAGLPVGEAAVRAVLPTTASATRGEGAGLPAELPDREGLDVKLSEALDAYERVLIVRALSAAGGVVAEAARRLQTDRPNLYRRMKRLGIAEP
jgi:two-component system nitrogen regulation response regulator NtrX